MRETRYMLKVQLFIEKQENTGGPTNADGTPVDPITNPPYWSSSNQERLSVSEDLNLGGMDFLGVMNVLGQLHNTIRAIK